MTDRRTLFPTRGAARLALAQEFREAAVPG